MTSNKFRSTAPAVAAWFALGILTSSPGGAQVRTEEVTDLHTHTHVVRESESLASIAQLYYGDPQKERILVAENSLENAHGIQVGMLLLIPWTQYYRVAQGDSWFGLAEAFYGKSHRSFVLTQNNPSSAATAPDPGAQLRVPYPLRHVVQTGDTLLRIAHRYYEDPKEGLTTIRRFNRMRTMRPRRGTVLLIPLSNLELTEQGRTRVTPVNAENLQEGRARKQQAAIDAQLPTLETLQRGGRYVELVALANRLLGNPDITESQTQVARRELALAYVALNAPDMATQIFSRMLENQPAMELDRTRTSPKVLRAFEAAQQPVRKPTQQPAEQATQ